MRVPPWCSASTSSQGNGGWTTSILCETVNMWHDEVWPSRLILIMSMWTYCCEVTNTCILLLLWCWAVMRVIKHSPSSLIGWSIHVTFTISWFKSICWLIFSTTAFSTAVQANNDFYQVTNVQFDDSLNIRSAAGAQNPIIGTIPANGRTILTTGNTQQVGSSTWMEVVWLGNIGWVNSYYLTNDSAPEVEPVQQQQRKKPAQINYNYQASDTSAAGNSGTTHTHPANRCTRSVTHTHPSNSANHEHRYSCQNNQVQNTGQAHTHPANECTRSVSHTHPNGSGAHSHRYSCQQMARPKYNPAPKYNQ